MSTCVRARLACAALVLGCAIPASAGTITIDLPTAIARARARAPEAIAALGRIDEARGKRVGAGVLFTQNPELELGGGRRLADPSSLALEAQLSQPLELGRRGPRIRVADAEIAHAQALRDAKLRELSFEVATVFYEARFSDLAVELARHDRDVAARAADAAARRRQAGEITDLDVDLARIALGRASSAVAAARSARAGAIGRLGALIGARPDDVITLAGELKPPPLAIERLRAKVATRADVRALETEARIARAERALAAARGRPEVGLWVGYQLDEHDTILLGGLTVTLPAWNRARGDAAIARARLRRTELERAAVVTAAARQVVDAFEAYARAREGVEIFEREVLPVIVDGEHLLERSIDTGQIAVHDYLVARQELLNGRREHLERQLQLAKAAAWVRFVAGVTP